MPLTIVIGYGHGYPMMVLLSVPLRASCSKFKSPPCTCGNIVAVALRLGPASWPAEETM